MKIFYSLLTSALSLFAISASAQHYVLSTPKTSIAVTANQATYRGSLMSEVILLGLFILNMDTITTKRKLFRPSCPTATPLLTLLSLQPGAQVIRQASYSLLHSKTKCIRCR